MFVKRAKVWGKLKEKEDEKIIYKIRKETVAQKSKEFIEKGMEVGLTFINRLLKRKEEITAKDWKLVADSIQNLHRIHQLELGKPTDISMYENMTPEQTLAYLKEVQHQLSEEHDMSMFSQKEDVPEELLLAEYLKDDKSIN